MIPDSYRKNFDTLSRAFSNGDVCLLECRDARGGAAAYVVCAVNRVGEEYELVPCARMFHEDPYETLVPPEPGT